MYKLFSYEEGISFILQISDTSDNTDPLCGNIAQSTQSMPGSSVQHISTCLYLLPTSWPILVYLQKADWF